MIEYGGCGELQVGQYYLDLNCEVRCIGDEVGELRQV